MSYINRISFWAETTGSPAYLTKSSKSADSPIVERPTSHAETTGSPAHSNLGVLFKAQPKYDTVSFKGETTGSPAYLSECPNDNCPECSSKEKNVSFKSRLDSYETKKKTSPLTYIAIAGGLGASAIAGLGYAHKKNAISKLSDGAIKDFIRPATKKCYDWCHSLKTSAVDLKNKMFN